MCPGSISGMSSMDIGPLVVGSWVAILIYKYMIKGYQSPNLSTSVSSQFLITTSTDFCPKDLFPRQAMDEWVLPKHQEAQEDPGAGLCNPRVSLVRFWGAQLVSWVSIHPTGNIYIYIYGIDI